MTGNEVVKTDADLLQGVREKLGLSQEELAKRLGASFSTINRWEQGHTKISRKYLLSLVEALFIHIEHRSSYRRAVPSDISVEEAVLALLMVREDCIHAVQGVIQPIDFYRETNKWVYEACLRLWERSDPINPSTVARELTVRGRLDAIGGAAFLSRIVEELPTPLGAEHYARVVRRDSMYRSLIGVAKQIENLGYEGGTNLEAALERAELMLLSLRRENEVEDFSGIGRLLEHYAEAPAMDLRAGLVGGVRTGFVDLDTLLGGLKRGDLTVVAARPSMGKTSLVLNIARNAAVGQNAKVAIFSLEMSDTQITQRLLVSESGVDSTKLRLDEHSEADEQRILGAMGVLAEAPIYIDDVAVQRVAELRAKAHRLHRDQGLDLIVVDYLQLLQAGTGNTEDRMAAASEITKSLKGLARELDVPVLVCSQLSRLPEQRVPHVPMLSDLRESGSIEQDADVVMFLYREDMYVNQDEWQRIHPNEHYPEGIAEIIVAKNRNGPTGTVSLRFRKEVTRFEDLDVRPYSP